MKQGKTKDETLLKTKVAKKEVIPSRQDLQTLKNRLQPGWMSPPYSA